MNVKADVEEVRRLYLQENMTDKQIADKLGMHSVSICNLRKRHGIVRPSVKDINSVRLECMLCNNPYYVSRTYNRQHRNELHLCDSCKKLENDRIIKENDNYVVSSKCNRKSSI